VGINVTGYSNPVFDGACAKASQSISSDPEYNFHQEAQAIFATDLPAIPLYQRLKIAATRPDFCGFTLDPSSPSALGSIETFDYGEACKRFVPGATSTPALPATLQPTFSPTP
jgi:peptide/nickel transport system substrate-binding protein